MAGGGPQAPRSPGWAESSRFCFQADPRPARPRRFRVPVVESAKAGNSLLLNCTKKARLLRSKSFRKTRNQIVLLVAVLVTAGLADPPVA